MLCGSRRRHERRELLRGMFACDPRQSGDQGKPLQQHQQDHSAVIGCGGALPSTHGAEDSSQAYVDQYAGSFLESGGQASD